MFAGDRAALTRILRWGKTRHVVAASESPPPSVGEKEVYGLVTHAAVALTVVVVRRDKREQTMDPVLASVAVADAVLSAKQK